MGILQRCLAHAHDLGPLAAAIAAADSVVAWKLATAALACDIALVAASGLATPHSIGAAVKAVAVHCESGNAGTAGHSLAAPTEYPKSGCAARTVRTPLRTTALS